MWLFKTSTWLTTSKKNLFYFWEGMGKSDFTELTYICWQLHLKVHLWRGKDENPVFGLHPQWQCLFSCMSRYKTLRLKRKTAARLSLPKMPYFYGARWRQLDMPMSTSEISQPVGAMAWLLTRSFTSTGIFGFEAASVYDEITHNLYFLYS